MRWVQRTHRPHRVLDSESDVARGRPRRPGPSDSNDSGAAGSWPVLVLASVSARGQARPDLGDSDALEFRRETRSSKKARAGAIEKNAHQTSASSACFGSLSVWQTVLFAGDSDGQSAFRQCDQGRYAKYKD